MFKETNNRSMLEICNFIGGMNLLSNKINVKFEYIRNIFLRLYFWRYEIRYS